jgi:hypothetical protein
LLSAYGPWSAFAISRQSQQVRLEKLLSASGIVSAGKIVPTSTQIPYEQRGELSDVIAYLVQWHGVNSFSPWLSDSTLGGLERNVNNTSPDSIAALLGFEFVPGWRRQRPDNENIYYTFKNYSELDISGYDHLFIGNNLPGPIKDSSYVFIMGIDTCRAWLRSYPPALVISLSPESKFGENLTSFALTEPLKNMARIGRSNTLPDSLLIFESKVNDFRIKAIVKQISADIHPDSIDINSISAYILFGENKALER